MDKGFKVNGEIKLINAVESGVSKNTAKAWKKVTFLIDNGAEYDNLYFFEIFGEEKVDKFIKFNKVGDRVDVSFNIKTNEWQGKYFVGLSAWSVFTDKSEGGSTEATEDDLPF